MTVDVQVGDAAKPSWQGLFQPPAGVRVEGAVSEPTSTVTGVSGAVVCQPRYEEMVACGERDCGAEVLRADVETCGGEMVGGQQYGCGKMLCVGHACIPPALLAEANVVLCLGCMATVVPHLCTRCRGELCEHDLAVVALADALAGREGGPLKLPTENDFIVAHELLGTVGVDPYAVLGVEFAPDGMKRGYVEGVVINGWMIGLMRGGECEVIAKLRRLAPQAEPECPVESEPAAAGGESDTAV